VKKIFWKVLLLALAVGVGLPILFLLFAPETGKSIEQEWKLPTPRKKGKVSLEEALSLRRSSKGGFLSKELEEKEIGQILWAARGVNRPDGKLTSPSAMGRYSVSVYIATGKGTFLYIPQNHSLSLVSDRDIRGRAGTQEYVKTAPAILLLVADLLKFPETLSLERKISFASAEAGTIGQNVYLECAALKLGTVFVGAVDKDFVKESLNFGEGLEPLFIMPIGYAR